MKGHVKLGQYDLVLAKMRDGYEYIEQDEVSKDLINTYLQYGCVLLNGTTLRYVYTDFSGGDMQETFSLRDVHYKTKNLKLLPQTTAVNSALAYFNPYQTLVKNPTGNVLKAIIVNNGNTHLLLEDINGITKYYINNEQQDIDEILTIFVKNDLVHIIFKDGNYYDYYSGN